MSNVRTLAVFLKPSVVVATATHDGTNNEDHQAKLEGFVVQAVGDVYFGGPDVSGDADGFTIPAGQSVNITGFLSRGMPSAYDLTRLYYIGGPWKLVIEIS